MPILHYRVDGGTPFIRTTTSDSEEGRIFPVWSPDSYALRVFEESRIQDKGKIDWDLFYQLKDEDHIVPGGSGAPEVHPNDIEQAQAIQELRDHYFEYALEGETGDEEELHEHFQNLLLLIQRVPKSELRNQHYLSLAERIKDLQSHEGEVQKRYSQQGRDALIRRVPRELHRDLKAYFQLGEEVWRSILGVGAGTEVEALTIITPEVHSDHDECKKVGELDQLSGLLKYAYEKQAQGMEVEIEVRIKQ